MSEVIYKNLNSFAAQLNIRLTDENFNFNIVQTQYFQGKFETSRYYGKDNHVGLIASANHHDDWRYHQPDNLKQLVFKCLHSIDCLPDASQFKTLVIDTDHDTLMPHMFHQAAKRCLFLNIPELYWNEKLVDVSVAEPNLLKAITVKPSPSQSSVALEKDFVVYKRYKQNYFLSPEITKVLNNLKTIPYIDIVKQYSADFLNELVKAKLIYFDAEEFTATS